MKFILKEKEGLKKLITRLGNIKTDIDKIAERDMLLSLLLINLEENSNYFSLCKSLNINPYSIESKKILLESVGENFKEEIKKNLTKIKNKIKEECRLDSNNRSKNTRERLTISLTAYVKFLGKIKRNYFQDSAYLENEKFDLNKKEKKLIKKIVELVEIKKEKSKRLYEIISNSLILYYNGLKDIDNSFSFLRFWIVVEMLVKAGGKLSNEEIIRRVSNIYNKELYGSLKYLHKKRNRIVHSYVFVSQDERNLMKSIAETTISFTLSKLRDISTLEELRGIFVKKMVKVF